jgi:GTP-binding protein HflX
VNETLNDLGARDKQMIVVFNKIDAYEPMHHHPGEEAHKMSLEDFKQSWMAKNNSPAIFISALKKENVDEFRALLYEKVKGIHTHRYPYDKLLY